MTHNPICCASCEKSFPAAHDGATVGNGCAAWVKDGILQGTFGSSTADLSRFTVQGMALQEDVLFCDGCITNWIEQGFLQEIETQVLPEPSSLHPEILALRAALGKGLLRELR